MYIVHIRFRYYPRFQASTGSGTGSPIDKRGGYPISLVSLHHVECYLGEGRGLCLFC